MKTGLESLEVGAPDITYSGNEGPKSPQEDQRMMQEFQMQQMAGGENNRVRELLLLEETQGLTEEEKEELRQLIKTISAQLPQGGLGDMPMDMEEDPRTMAAGGGIMNNKKIKGQDHMLAYITPNEADKLVKLGGQETMTPEGILAYPEYDNYGFSSQSDFDSGDVSRSNDPNVRGEGTNFDGTPQNRVTAQQLAATNAAEKKAEADRIEKERRAKLTIREKIAEYNKNYKEKQKERYTVSKINELNKKLGNVNVDFFGDTEETYGDIIGANAPSVTNFGPEGTGKYSQEFIDDVLSGKRAPPESFSPIDISKVPGGLLTKGLATGANIIGKGMAGPTTKEELMDIYSGNKTGNSYIGARDLDVDKMTGKEMMEIFEPNRYAREYGPTEGGGGPPIILPYPTTTGMTTADADPEDLGTDFTAQFTSRDLTDADKERISNIGGKSIFLADGGRASYADGGITDLRQGYFLGKLVKKAVRGIKKVAKSPIGMAALGYLGSNALMGKTGMSLFSNPFKNILSQNFMQKGKFARSLYDKLLMQKVGDKYSGNFDPFKVGIGGLAALTGLMAKNSEDDEQSLDEYMKSANRGPSINPMGIRQMIAANKGNINPQDFAFLNPAYYQTAADGGRIGLAVGGLGTLRGALSKQMFGYGDDDEDDVKKLAMGGSAGMPPVTMMSEGQNIKSFNDDESMNMAQGTQNPMPMPIQRPMMDPRMMQMMMAQQQGGMKPMMGNRMMAAMGGRMGFADGGDEGELLDMGGLEKDYRNEGGFVPMGEYERKDDVPARLSKNEFVFTADAVRNAGGGDIDKGAEIMENMMENLEQGGKVSKGSQGLSGAREMFATQQRLGEVL